jgi:hypothetical protein
MPFQVTRQHNQTPNTIVAARDLTCNNNVTDLINALPGYSSVNTVQNATIEEAVFSVFAVTSRSGGWWSRDLCFLWCVSVPRLYKWQNSFGSGTSQFSVGDSHGKFVVGEELEVSLWRFNMWFEDFMCAVHSDIRSVWFSETFIVPVL